MKYSKWVDASIVELAKSVVTHKWQYQVEGLTAVSVCRLS